MTKTTCYHVRTARGAVYGVTATGKRDALAMVADRLAADGTDDTPASATRVGGWTAPYGTVLEY